MDNVTDYIGVTFSNQFTSIERKSDGEFFSL